MGANTITVTEDNFESLISGKDIVVLDWWAEWCGPCRAFAPIFEAASTRHADIKWGKVDTEAQQGLAAEFGISSIPTLMVFRENVMVFAQPGMLPATALDKLVEQVKALDMKEVHAAIEAHEKAHADGTCNHDHGDGHGHGHHHH